MSRDDQELEELISLHEGMLQWARKGSWAEVAATEEIRRDRLQQFFRQPVAPERAERVRSALETMLEANNQIMHLVQKSRGDLGLDISSIRNGRRALAAYGENTQRRGKGMSEKS